MCHFPLHRWEHCEKGSIMLHGHSHSKVDLDNNKLNIESNLIRIDVGLDGHLANYKLISIIELNNYINLLKN